VKGEPFRFVRGHNMRGRRSESVAARRREILTLYGEGRSQREIAALLGMAASTVALDLQTMGYKARATYSTFEPGLGRVTAQDAASRFGVRSKTLCAAIDAGIVRGRRVELGGRLHSVWTVDPDELEHDLGRLPRCGYEGCVRPALGPVGGCSGPHARAIQMRGGEWRTPEAIERSNAAKRGVPRPDVRERVAAMHADKDTRYRWGVALAEGRKLPAKSQRRWKGRLGGLEAGGGDGRPRGYTNEQEQRATALLLDSRKRSDEAIGRVVGMTRRQVQLLRAKVARNPS
jgi:hypothetical protein